MEYNFREIETKWRAKWQANEQYKVSETKDKASYYVLDMFPYPSGAGLHVGHPLGYIASDIIARYKRHQGFNVLHPMGYDSFGLPAEQYAIETGQHPALTTEQNIKRYREQLDQIGFSYDWSREVRTSDPSYYRWTQWIFAQLFDAWYNLDSKKAEPISSLIEKFETNGSYNANAAQESDWWKELDRAEFPQFSEYFEGEFTAVDWKSFSERQKALVLMHYRLTYLADSVVNWCPALGTVLANDEIVNGLSERGGHPVEQKKMRQWMMRITAYADRLLNDLDGLDWSDSIKEIQRNWIGKSRGAQVSFGIDGHEGQIEVFTTRPDTIFGVDFMVLAPEHELVDRICSAEQGAAVKNYQAQAAAKTERERQGEAKTVSGCFTGAYAVHPLSGRKLPVYIADYVLASYGTGAIMAVPAGDERDWRFAQSFGIEMSNIFDGADLAKGAYTGAQCALIKSDFLNGMSGSKAKKAAIEELEKRGVGKGSTNYRLRDAVFSRQRYWGEPFPIYYDEGIPKRMADKDLPSTLPEVDKYLPTSDGEPPLARAQNWSYEHRGKSHPLETNTMPGWAGSSWYFLRYMDPHNPSEFCSKEKADYWGQVDFYMGGAEHATGHLLYSRFWTKVLFDLGFIAFDEPFKKLVNQGMIQGRSSLVHRLVDSNTFVSADCIGERQSQRLRVDISLVNNDVLDIEGFKAWRSEYAQASFELNQEGKFLCESEVEKMSKSKYNVQTPDELIEKFGADTLRCYEMFLGPVEQHKPWDTKGINGVHNFLRKLWRLYHDDERNFIVADEKASPESLKSLHKTIKKVSDDLDRLSWNTVVSALMICVNELTDQKCRSREVLDVLPVLLSPYAPHMAEELWELLGMEGSVTTAPWPKHEEKHLKESSFAYPVSFNGKVRFKLELDLSLSPTQVEEAVLAYEKSSTYLEGKAPKKVIVVPGRIINIVI